jgi:DNA-binding transcriptional ArsR family regulator
LENPEKAEIYRLHAEFCKLLADANRLLIINELGKGELSVSELMKRLDLKQSNVSKHLSLMRERGLVNTRRDGSTVFYSLTDRRVSQAIQLLKDVQSDQISRQRILIQSVPEIK